MYHGLKALKNLYVYIEVHKYKRKIIESDICNTFILFFNNYNF